MSHEILAGSGKKQIQEMVGRLRGQSSSSVTRCPQVNLVLKLAVLKDKGPLMGTPSPKIIYTGSKNYDHHIFLDHSRSEFSKEPNRNWFIHIFNRMTFGGARICSS